MKKSGVKNWAGGALISLASLASGCGYIIPNGLPSNDPIEGRHLDVYEGDIKNSSEQYLSFKVGRTKPFLYQPVSVAVLPLNDLEDRKPPFDSYARSEKINQGKEVQWYVDFRDNSRKFSDGEIWTVYIQSGTILGFDSPAETVSVSYKKGNSPGNLTGRVEELEDNGVPTDGIDGELERLVNYSCGNLPRSPGTNVRLYRVTPNDDGFVYSENAELTPNPNNPEAEGNFIHHIIPKNSTGYQVAVSGRGVGDVREMFSGVGGHNPPECPHILILNPEQEKLPEEVFSVEVKADTDTTEVIRVR
ncbi:MAG: hypothetical protein AABX73_00320 [Nanoarchaeota archaeon]